MNEYCNCFRCQKINDDPSVGNLTISQHDKIDSDYECSCVTMRIRIILEYITKFSKGEPKLVKTDCSRVEFMKKTITEIHEYYSKQSKCIKINKVFIALTKYLSQLMMDVVFMLDRITSYGEAVTQNFDIFEWKILEVFLVELKRMFPINNYIPKLSELINDHDAREAWFNAFGLKYMVSYDEFIKMININFIGTELEFHSNVLQKIEYTINFPSRDIITPCKWDYLIKLFGPCDKLVENLNKFGKDGFLGYTNRIQACEILKNERNMTVLFRFSRSEPGFFAFSYKDNKGRISHQINEDRKTGKPIPVREFLNYRFPRYTLAQYNLNLDKILDLPSSKHPLSNYASQAGAYWSPDLDLSEDDK